jgi:hypothetical protein
MNQIPNKYVHHFRVKKTKPSLNLGKNYKERNLKRIKERDERGWLGPAQLMKGFSARQSSARSEPPPCRLPVG